MTQYNEESAQGVGSGPLSASASALAYTGQKAVDSDAWRYAVWFNLLLITAGATIMSLGINGAARPHELLTGGIGGTALLITYVQQDWNLSLTFLGCSVPIFVLGFFFVSRRFVLYSVYAMLTTTLMLELLTFDFGIKDQFVAVAVSGGVIGIGSGIVLHSLGSSGGTDIIAIILHKLFGIRHGQTYMGYDLLLFSVGLSVLPVDTVVYSLIITFIVGNMADGVLTMFNQRKMVLVISDHTETISPLLGEKLGRGATYLSGYGSYTGREKRILLTVVPMVQIKRLERIIFNADPDAFVIIGNTFNVLGSSFGRSKIY